ncbi:Gfo/Idh/MocA family protein [Radiobacillus sp. PE A8.2]|uniref:Gfo/Idh/MocA family protein n=1 Tax=Radiobacillus sp. PE A8.2 TaxID=3380349 RepID=UPI00388FA26A
MKKVKVGFIGVGGIASVHMANIAQHEHADIVAVCDIVEASARAAGEKFGATVYTDSSDLLEKEKIDALFICVPPFAHGNIEEKAAQLGIHLMVEKPIGLDLPSVQTKLKAIEDAGILCATGYCLRYLDTIEKAKGFLNGREIAMVRGYYLTSFVHTPWFREIEKSGGQLVEQATHILDLIRYLCGEINQVYANMNLNVLKDIPNINIPDVTSLNFTFESGAVGHLDCSLTQPDHRMGLEILGKDFRVEVNGTDVTIVEKDKKTIFKSNVNFYEQQDKAFIEAVQTNDTKQILSTYENGIKTLAVTLAAYESNETNTRIVIK